MKLNVPFFRRCYRPICAIGAFVLLDSALRAQVPNTDSSTKPDARAEAKPAPAKLLIGGVSKPTPDKDVSISFNPALLKDIVDAIERRIPNWPQRGSWKMPNVVFGSGVESARVSGPMILSGVTPMEALTLAAAAAGCVLEPITALTDDPYSQYKKDQVIGYRFQIDTTRTGITTMEHSIEQRYTKLDLSTVASKLEEEIIRLARERLEQVRQLYKSKPDVVSLNEVEEAESELAQAEARGDKVKRAEARLNMAAKYLERIEGVHRTGNISDAEYNQAKQRKLEAELDLQRALTAAFPKTEKNSGTAVVILNFHIRHRLANEIADGLRQILLNKPGHEVKPSTDNLELLVTASPEVMTRVQTFITVTDWPDPIIPGSDFQSRNNSVTRAARSFFYACAVEDSAELFSKQLSLGVLAKLKGDTKSKEFEGYQWGRAEVDPNWEKSLRADWPGKKEAIKRLVREWNRYPLKRLSEDPGVAIGFGVKYSCSVSFEGAPKPFYQITIEPDRTKQSHDGETSFLFSSLPPWWNGDSTKPSDAEPANSPGDATDPNAAALDLSYPQFDQTPHSGWRVLAQDEKRFREAAALIEAYLLHDGLHTDERVNLHFHAAQCLAFAGDPKSVLDALEHLKQSHYVTEPPDFPLRWNDYVDATQAFLKGNLDALKSAHERIAAGPKLNGEAANLDVVDRLIARFGKPYRDAYNHAEPQDPQQPSANPFSE